MIELYILLFSVYILVIGLFVEKLTNLWLWTSFGLSLVSFLYFFSGYKNLILIDFFYGLNLGLIFITFFFVLVSFYVLNQVSSYFRDIFLWIFFYHAWFIFGYIFVGDFSCFQTNLVEYFYVGFLNGGSFYHDIKLLVLVVCFLTFVAVYHQGVLNYEYDYSVLLLLRLSK